jgi:hypothetical protein
LEPQYNRAQALRATTPLPGVTLEALTNVVLTSFKIVKSRVFNGQPIR